MNGVWRIFLIGAFSVLSACSSMSSQSGADSIAIDSLRGAPPFDRRAIKVEIDRDNYQKAIEKEGSTNDARLVQVYHRGESENDMKEYRLMDIRPGSVYDLLQLRQADVLIATNGYVVPTPGMFWNYLKLIAHFEAANIEIRRGGIPILYEYTFKE